MDNPTVNTFELTRVPIVWHVSETISPKYATNIVVQRAENEVIISFFEIYPPILVGSPEEIAEKASALGSVTAECIARIIISPAKLPELIESLQTINTQFTNSTKESLDK